MKKHEYEIRYSVKEGKNVIRDRIHDCIRAEGPFEAVMIAIESLFEQIIDNGYVACIDYKKIEIAVYDDCKDMLYLYYKFTAVRAGK